MDKKEKEYLKKEEQKFIELNLKRLELLKDINNIDKEINSVADNIEYTKNRLRY